MKPFQFRLARVLHLREGQLKTEEAKLEQLLLERARMESERDALEASLERARASVKSQQFVNPADLVTLQLYDARVQRERKQWATRLTAHNNKVEAQKASVIEARGRVRLLEKLREKRETEWRSENDRALEELAADFSAAQWLRVQE